MKKYVILVDKNNNEIGRCEKQKAHIDGKLHRAFSILIFNSKGQLLIQQRTQDKYHCGGLRTNTVCSHPGPGETYEQATHRRLQQEMGFDCELEKTFCFLYKAKFPNGLIENEHDCVFVGKYNQDPKPDPTEIMDYKRIDIKLLNQDIKKIPTKYTPRFKKILRKLMAGK